MFISQQEIEWRPGRDLDPGPAGDSRIYYSDIDAVFINVTGLYYQGYHGVGAVVTKEIF
jgi:hypothetical protein